MVAKFPVKVSSGDTSGQHPYMMGDFWCREENWHWLKYKDDGLNERMYRRIVLPAIKECLKKNRF